MSTDEVNLTCFLLVEDDDDHAYIVERSLKRERIVNSIARVKDGVEAMKYLRKESGYESVRTPDVILLDLKLPKKDGHEVLAEVKADEYLRLIPVVILTTSDSEIDKLKASQNYANSYLVKPLEGDTFKKMVQDLSLYWGVWNRSPAAAKKDNRG